MAKGTICPKCEYVRKAEEPVPEWQCPSCQIVYAKFQQSPVFAGGSDLLRDETAALQPRMGQPWEEAPGQNLGYGIAAGAGAAVVGALIWAVISAATNYQIGWMAIGVGALVGYAVRLAGKGADASFGIVAALLALLGCVIGNFLTVVIIISNQEALSILTILTRITPAILVSILADTFRPMDLLFYGFAIYEGYRFAIVRPEEG